MEEVLIRRIVDLIVLNGTNLLVLRQERLGGAWRHLSLEVLVVILRGQPVSLR